MIGFEYDITVLARHKAEKCLTDLDLARAVGCHPSTIKNVLTGRTCNPKTIKKIAFALDVPVASIVKPAAGQESAA